MLGGKLEDGLFENLYIKTMAMFNKYSKDLIEMIG